MYSDEPDWVKKDFPFGIHEHWDVIETEILE